jgi:predicted Zn-dependent peptidase
MREVHGVPIYYKNFPTSPCVHVRLIVNSGPIDEPAKKEGLSHFLEHLAFTGCTSIPDKKATKAWSKKNALNSWNAGTGIARIRYHLRCLPDKYIEVIKAMSDMIFHPLLRAVDIEEERKVIIQEAWGRYQNEKLLKFCKEISENTYNGHTKSRLSSPLGWPETIENITRDDLVSWHKDNFGIGNIYIVLTGAVDESHVDSWADILKDLPKLNPLIRDYGKLSLPLQNRIERNAKDIGRELEQLEVSFSRVMPKESVKEDASYSILTSLLYDILFERLRYEKSLCYGVSVDISNSTTECECHIGVKADKNNLTIIEEEISAIIQEIKDGKHEEKFNIAKALRLEQTLSRERLASDIADSVANEIHIDGLITNTDTEIKQINSVTHEDIIRITTKVFDKKYIVETIIYPTIKE